MNLPIILASQSPQRRILLEQVGFTISCCPVDIDETPLAAESPSKLVLRLALQKAQRCLELQEAFKVDFHADFNEAAAVACVTGSTESTESTESTHTKARAIIGADTTIDLDGTSLGKPTNESEAMDMLLSLAQREHLVHTGVCVIDRSTAAAQTQLVTTIVRFGPVSSEHAKRYWDSGEPIGKAGAYGIQGLGAQFVAHLSGSYSNVVGLPLYETLRMVDKVTA